jgi:hypothetical protein
MRAAGSAQAPTTRVTPFHEIVQLWSTFFHTAESSELGPHIAALEAAACGFTHATLYRGARLTGDLLITIAREQVAAMDTLRSITARDASTYVALTSWHGFLYFREISGISPEPDWEGFPATSSGAHAAKDGQSRPLYIALLGQRDSVLMISSRLDEVFNTAIATDSTAFA